MKHSIGMFVWSAPEYMEKADMRRLYERMKTFSKDKAELARYINKLCEYHSIGEYDHLKAIDLIFYATDHTRKKIPAEMRPRIYTSWQLARAIVLDLEKNHFQFSKSMLQYNREQEIELENKIFAEWLENYKKGLTNRAVGGYNIYGTS